MLASKMARLRCPLCKHELLACDLVQGVNRTWSVIEDPGGEDLFSSFQSEPERVVASIADDNLPVVPHAADGPEDVAAELDADAEYRLQEEHSPNPNSEEGEEGESSGKNIDWQKFKPISHDEFQRRRRGNTSIIGLLFSWFGGGFLAIPISLLIMWHVLGTDIGAGPYVADYVPWIVPQKFHRDRPMRFDDEIEDADKNGQEQGIGRRKKFDKKFDVWEGDKLAGPNDALSKPKLPSMETTDPNGNGEKDGVVEREIDAPSMTPIEKQSELNPNPKTNEISDSSIKIRELGNLLGDWENTSREWIDNTEQDRKIDIAKRYRLALSQVGVALSDIAPSKLSNRTWYDKAERLLRNMASSAKQMELAKSLDASIRKKGIPDKLGFLICLSESELQTLKESISDREAGKNTGYATIQLADKRTALEYPSSMKLDFATSPSGLYLALGKHNVESDGLSMLHIILLMPVTPSE